MNSLVVREVLRSRGRFVFTPQHRRRIRVAERTARHPGQAGTSLVRVPGSINRASPSYRYGSTALLLASAVTKPDPVREFANAFLPSAAEQIPILGKERFQGAGDFRDAAEL